MYFPFLFLSNLSFIYEKKGGVFSDLSMVGKYTTLSAKIILHIVHIIETWLEEVIIEEAVI